VMIVAIAALMLLFVKYAWDQWVYNWVKNLVTNITNWDANNVDNGQ